MARIVLVLVIGTAGMFFFVLRTPPQFIRQAWSEFETLSGMHSEGGREEEEPEAKPMAKPRRAAARVSQRESAVSPERGVPSATPAIGAPARVYPRVLIVATDGTALYSLNSTDGKVVGVLSKGDVVEPQLEIKDASQTWAYVSVSGQRMSGFLRKDSLEQHRLEQMIR